MSLPCGLTSLDFGDALRCDFGDLAAVIDAAGVLQTFHRAGRGAVLAAVVRHLVGLRVAVTEQELGVHVRHVDGLLLVVAAVAVVHWYHTKV